MNEKTLESIIHHALMDVDFADVAEVLGMEDDVPVFCDSIHSFEEKGLMTNNAGLVLSFTDGSEYQVTIVCRKNPRGE